MPEIDLAGSLLPLIGAGFGVGLMIGLTGVAGAALMTPLLISTFGASPQVAVGTDLLYASLSPSSPLSGVTSAPGISSGSWC